MVLIDLYDGNIINSLVGIKTVKPDYLYVLIDKSQLMRKQRQNIYQNVELLVPGIKVEFVNCDGEMLEDVNEKLEQIINLNKDDQIYLDLTGGQGLMAVAGFYASRSHENVKMIYTELKTDSLIDVHTMTKLMDLTHLSLEDYLAAIGAKKHSNAHMPPPSQDFDRIIAASEYIFEHLEAWKQASEYIQHNKTDVLTVDLTDESQKQLFAMFDQYGFITKNSEGNYNYANARYKQYLNIYGVWLEMYVYIKLKECYDEVHLSYVIDWNNSDEIDVVDNEIDVVFMNKSEVNFVSCKMRTPDMAAGYQVGYLAKRLAGISGKSFLVTTDNVYQGKGVINTLFSKYIQLNVGLIEVNDLKTRNSQEVFEEVLNQL